MMLRKLISGKDASPSRLRFQRVLSSGAFSDQVIYFTQFNRTLEKLAREFSVQE